MTLPQGLLGQTTTVDLEAWSRYTEGGDDRATFSSTLVFADPVTEEQLQEAAQDAQVTVAPGGLAATVVQTLDIAPSGPETYQVRVEAPLPGFDLVKNGDVSVTVLLPRAAVYPRGPVFEVELNSVSIEGARAITFGDGMLPSLGGRIAVTFSRRQDPESIIEYAYRTLRERT